jgi:hypothetical protein
MSKGWLLILVVPRRPSLVPIAIGGSKALPAGLTFRPRRSSTATCAGGRDIGNRQRPRHLRYRLAALRQYRRGQCRPQHPVSFTVDAYPEMNFEERSRRLGSRRWSLQNVGTYTEGPDFTDVIALAAAALVGVLRPCPPRLADEPSTPFATNSGSPRCPRRALPPKAYNCALPPPGSGNR